jgi:hypothetical protein
VEKSRTPEQKKTEDDQVRAFRKAARELGCDESEERFQDALRTIAKQKPKPKERQAKERPQKTD